MPDFPITLVPWFDAKDNPPVSEQRPLRHVATDRGTGWFGSLDRCWWSTGTGKRMEPQPSVWCDPSPPSGDDALTVEDLRLVLDSADGGIGEMYGITDVGKRLEAIARLRRALDQTGTHERKDDQL